MDPKYTGPVQLPPELREKLGITDEKLFVDPEKIKRKVRNSLILGFLPFILIALGVASIFVFPHQFASIMEYFDPGPIKGKMYDLTFVPDGGDGKVWLVTNPSFAYVQTIETPGSYSMSTECVGCKIRLYIYDWKSGEVISQKDMPVVGMLFDADLKYLDGEVWLTARETDNNAPFIGKYDAATGEQIHDTESFVAAHPELTAPVIGIIQFENPFRLNLKLADGKEYIYLPEENRFFADSSEFYDFNNTSETITIFTLVKESSDARSILYTITGPKENVYIGHCDSYADDPESLKFFCEATSKKLDDRVFLEAFIVYSDDQMAVIFSQDSMGKEAKRQLTAYDVEGNMLWEIPQERLFNEIRFDPADPFSSTFFIESRLFAERAGDVFVFIVEDVGAVAADVSTGEELWKIIP